MNHKLAISELKCPRIVIIQIIWINNVEFSMVSVDQQHFGNEWWNL